MIKFAAFIAVLFALCSCASSQPDPAPVALNPAPESLQASADATGDDPGSAELVAGVEAVDVDAEDKEFCTKEHRTGSRIPVKYCRTRKDDERNREHSQGWLEKVKKTPQHSIDVSG